MYRGYRKVFKLLRSRLNMDWKAFFKPTLAKVLLAIPLTIIIRFIFTPAGYCTEQMCVDFLAPSLAATILLIVPLAYVSSCVMVLIYSRLRSAIA